MKKIDLTGQRFGRLFVIKRVGTSKDGQKVYLCRCDCGTEKEIKSGNLRSGHTLSCGCYNADRLKKMNDKKKKHGGCGTRLYRIWFDMRQRCNYDKSINWHLYGGRGIKVCDEWENDFETFRAWAIPNGYNDGLQLDRIDNDGNYEPENCKWSTISEQGNNRRTCIYITINGETKSVTEWCKKTGIARQVAYSRIRRGWSPEKSVTEKPCPLRKLSEKDVRYIRKHYAPENPKYNNKAMAEKFNVSGAAIEAITGGRN